MALTDSPVTRPQQLSLFSLFTVPLFPHGYVVSTCSVFHISSEKYLQHLYRFYKHT